MNTIEALPDSPINANGPFCRKFLELGIESFRSACYWVKNLAYGYNSDRNDPYILFTENRGVCSTKHSTIGLLAVELGLPVTKFLGFYKLNDSIITGINAVLEPYQIDYIPQIHCFLGNGTTFVDLTEGNCTGKNKLLEDYDLIVKVKPDLSESEQMGMYHFGLEYYKMTDNAFKAFGNDELVRILKECNQTHRLVCSMA